MFPIFVFIPAMRNIWAWSVHTKYFRTVTLVIARVNKWLTQRPVLSQATRDGDTEASGYIVIILYLNIFFILFNLPIIVPSLALFCFFFQVSITTNPHWSQVWFKYCIFFWISCHLTPKSNIASVKNCSTIRQLTNVVLWGNYFTNFLFDSYCN